MCLVTLRQINDDKNTKNDVVLLFESWGPIGVSV